MAVPYIFATATGSIPLSQFDSNWATPITLGNTASYLGNTISTVGNLTLATATLTNATLATATLTNATLVTPLLGTPTSGNLTNCKLPVGSVIQTVVVNYSTHSTTSSSTPSATGLTATITPRFNNSKVLVSAVGNFYQQGATGQGNAYIYNGSTQLSLIGQFYSATAGYLCAMAGSYLDSPATTSAVTYNLYFSSLTGTVDFNINNPNSTLILMEIQQ